MGKAVEEHEVKVEKEAQGQERGIRVAEGAKKSAMQVEAQVVEAGVSRYRTVLYFTINS